MNELENYYNEIYIRVGYVILIFILLPILIGILRWRYLNTSLRIFFWYLLSVFSYNILEHGFVWSVNEHTKAWEPFLVMFDIEDTNFLNVISRLLDYVFLGWFYSVISEGSFGVWVKRVTILIFVLAAFVYFFVDGFRSYGNVNALLNRVYLVTLTVLYLWSLFRSNTMLNLWRNSYFLISIGLLFPNLFGLFLSFVGDKINQTDFVLFVKISLLRNAFTAIGLLLFCLAFKNARYTKFILTSKERIIHT